MTESQPAEIGEVLSGYRLESVIGRGGMGWVYGATHTRLKRRAAIKVLATQHAADRSLVSRFFQEARIASAIHHPNIVDVFDFVEQESPRRIACIMELLEGPSLSEVLTDRRLKFIQAINATIQLASAVEAVHKKGVTHRDLKPGNVIVLASLESDFSETPAVKVCDFGIAKAQEATGDVRTRAGMMLGTPAYMSPEQIAGEPVGPETDLYALAEILCEMLTGTRLFEGTSADVMRAKLLHSSPEIVLSPNIYGHDRLSSLLRACLAPERAARPTLADFRDALLDLREEEQHARVTPSVEAETHFVPRSDGSETLTDPPHPIGDMLEPPGDTETDFAPVTQPHVQAVQPAPVSDPAIGAGFDEKINTGYFYNRIVEADVAVAEEKPPAPVSPPTERDPTPPPREKPRAIRESRPSVPPPPPVLPRVLVPIIRGAPVEKKNKTLLIFVVAAAIAGGGGFAARSYFTEPSDVPITAEANPSSLQQILEKRRDQLGEIKGTAREHLDRAVELMKHDRWASYEKASAEIASALVLDPKNAGAMGLFVENELTWRAELLDPIERAALVTIAETAAKMTSSEPAVVRAQALLETEPAPCFEHVDSLKEDRARAIALFCRASLAGAASGAAVRLRDRLPLGADAAAIAADIEALAGADRLRAEALVKIGRPLAATKILEKRLKADPKNSAVLRAIAGIEKHSGKIEAAIAHLNDASSADGWGMLARIELGYLYLDLERWTDAGEVFEVVISEVNLGAYVRAAAYVGSSRAELGRKRYEEAKKKASGALALVPGMATALIVRAEAELEKRAFSEAKDYAQRALVADPKSANAAIVLGRVAMEDARLEVAAELFAHAALAAPEDDRVVAIVFASRVDRDGAKAVSALAAIEKHDPGDRAWSSRVKLAPSPGAVLWAAERLRALETKSAVPGAINAALGVLYYGSSRPLEAFAAMERALAAGGTGAEKIALAYQVQIAVEAGDVTKADRAVKELLKREPDLAVAAALTRRVKRER